MYRSLQKVAVPMTLEELKLRRLAGQHLLTPTDTQTVVKDLLDVQAQFISHRLVESQKLQVEDYPVLSR